MNFRLSNHAREEMERREIPSEYLRTVLENPQQVVPEKSGKKAYQSKVVFGEDKVFLLRAIVADNVDPAVVVTVYRTSRVGKYWRST